MRTAWPDGSVMRRLRRCLEHAELGLQRGHVATERLEGLRDPLAVVALLGGRQVVEPRERRQRRGGPDLVRSSTSSPPKYEPSGRLDRGNLPNAHGSCPAISRTEHDPQLAQLLLRHVGGRSAHRVDARLVLRERDQIAEVRLAAERHQHPLDAERDAAVRRRAHRERVEQEPELRALLLRREPERVEDLRCSSGSWIRNEPPPISIPFTTMS